MPRRLYLSRTPRNADRSPVRASFRAGSAAHDDTEQDREARIVRLLLRTSALARFFFDGRHDFHEAFHIVGGHAAADRLFQIDEVPVDASGNLRRRCAVGVITNVRRSVGADFARDQAARRQPIENARQRGALVREAAMQLGDRRRCRASRAAPGCAPRPATGRPHADRPGRGRSGASLGEWVESGAMTWVASSARIRFLSSRRG